jgi:predicted YcjX-like family ATPase
LVVGQIAEGVSRGVERVGSTVSGAFFEPVVRLGVTGLSRAGKTVFITSLVSNLLDRERMPGLRAASQGGILAAYLQPQPDDTVPRFDYERHLADLTGATPRWPEGTRTISELRLSLRVRPGGLLRGLKGPRTVHLDIVDYPGEWLLDLSLLERDFAAWSARTLARMERRAFAAPFLEALRTTDPAAAHDEATARRLAGDFTAYLTEAREHGFSDCTPGRFLLPGEMAGSPVLTFAPLPERAHPRGSLGREFARRYAAYCREIVKPFFRDHFARIDRQVVLVDVLEAIHGGPATLEDLRVAMADLLGAFRPGRNRWLSQILLGRRVERILFAATKADHLHHRQHPRLTAITEALLAEARRRAEFAGADTAAMAIAALRTTTEESAMHQGRELDMVRGTLLDGRQAAFYAGALPEDPGRLLAAAREGAEQWLDADYGTMHFRPSGAVPRAGEGLAHIRLDRAAEFLIGDVLR